MASEAAIPPDLWGRVQKMIDDAIGAYARSGPLRNATISGGAGLSVRDGGALRLVTADGVEAFYVGPVWPDLPDGSPQPGLIVRRNDGTIALHLYDPIPGALDYNQFLAWRDRAGNVVLSDDTDSGQGHARPWLDHAFYLSRSSDFPTTAVTAFETIWRAKLSKQQPRLYVECWGVSDTAGAVGEVQVMVNGARLGAVEQTASGVVRFFTFGPDVVAGAFGNTLNVEVQARRASGTGTIRVGAAWVQGRQS